MTQYIAIMNDGQELMHYGKLGMKWGRHRALSAAKAAGRAASEAKGATKESKRVADKFSNTAREADKGAQNLAREGKIFRSATAKTYADANKKRAQEVTDEGRSIAAHYERVNKSKTMKAQKLVEKYGDEETKKKVESLIKEHAKKPATGWEGRFDDTDPVAAAVQNTLDAAKRARAYQQSSQSY